MVLLLAAAGSATENATAAGVFIASDSTAAEYPPERYPRMGWGQVLSCRFDEGIDVHDEAASGRSTRTFIAEKRLEKIAAELQPGDTLLIQFGHNDAVKNAPDKYTSPDDYVANLEKFIAVAREKGAQPVLITPVTMLRFRNGEVVETHKDYAPRMKALAESAGVPLVDLDSASRAYFTAMGQEEARKYYLFYTPEDQIPAYPKGVSDPVHFSELGARAVAGMIADGLAKLEIPLASQVEPAAEGDLELHQGPGCN